MFLETLASNRWHNKSALLLTLGVLLALAGQVTRAQLDMSQLELVQGASIQPQPQHNQQEILAQPNSQVRIECKLPHLDSSNLRFFHWNFQRTADNSVKPHILCYESKCSDGPTFGIQLDMDKETGSYDLLINNVTYELNDGFYYCDYKDSTPETRQTINREFRLTVLIPPQAPTLAPVLAAPAREGQEYQLGCASHGGNPEPNITWFRNDQLISQTSGVRIEQTKFNGTTSSTLSWLPSVDDHLASYKCQVWNKAMSPMQSHERELRLRVEFPPQAPTLAPVLAAPAREGQEYQLGCASHGGNPEPNITWFRNDQLISQTSGVRIEQTKFNGTTSSTLSWLPSVDDHLASYKCQVWNKAMSPMQSHERELRLRVEYAPRINVGPHNPLKVLQGQTFSLSCQVDANPAVKGIRWLKNGEPISNQFNLTIHEAKLSDSSVYACQADNGIAQLMMGAPTLGGLHGQVVGPSSSLLSLFGLGAGGDAQSTRSPTAVEAQLPVQVLYAPRVQVRASKSQGLAVGDFLSLNCSVDAWPPAHEILWTREDEPNFRRLSSAGRATLDFASVSAADVGNYTCTAFNRLDPSGQPGDAAPIERQGSGSAMVLVRHRPGIAEIQLGKGGETELGAPTQIQCRAKPPGYPEPKYRFWRYQGASGQKIPLSRSLHGAVYTIHAAKAEDEAKFACQAYNEMGETNEASAELIVNEPPKIIDDATRRNEDTRSVSEHAFSFTVRASGKPEPKVSWFQRSPVDGKRLDLSSLEQQARVRIETSTKTEQTNQGRLRYIVVTSLVFRNPLEVDDRGRYYVEFTNGPNRVAVEEFQLHINHPPIPAPRNQPLLSPGSALLTLGAQQQLQQRVARTKAGFDLGENVSLTCRVSAWPKPEFLWYANGVTDSDKPIDTNSRYTSTIVNPVDDIWESTLTFSQAQKSDYGEYMCVTANQQANRISDSVHILVNLSRKSPPDAPSQLEVVDSTPDSVSLQWIAGFDGGFPLNQFIVQYAPDDGQSLARRFPNPMDAHQPTGAASDEQSARFFDCQAANPCTIQQLAPRQAYVFRVWAKNELGLSEPSEEVRALTRANASQIPKISDASYDLENNILYFRIEPNSDYLLNNLQARIETKLAFPEPQPYGLEPSAAASSDLASQQDWSPLTKVANIRQERVEARLNMPREAAELRITLCSRANESLCGPEFSISMKSATSSFVQEQRGLSLSILISSLTLIVVLGALATSAHSCCLSRKSKKAAAIERVDASIDNKPNGAAAANQKSTHGSTTSTNSTSAGATNQAALQSLDSINAFGGVANGGVSDHSSDHSRQAKLDSMLPPNYNHYADRATMMLEQQQQQQQQQMMMQQQAIMSDIMGSPYGLPNSALLSVANQMPSPAMLGPGGQFAYSQAQLDGQQPRSIEQQHLDPNSQLLGAQAGLFAVQDADQQQQQMWPGADYSAGQYNSLAGYQSQQQHQEQMMESPYGRTGGMVPPATYDGQLTDQFHQSAYLGAYNSTLDSAQYQQQQQQYQQEMAAAQQQMYGTLSRSTFDQSAAQSGVQANNNSSSNSNNNGSQLDSQQQYSTTNGLVQPTHLAPAESDYGTTGARNGRLIREIIV